MTRSATLREVSRCLFIIALLLIAGPSVSKAQEQKPEFQGYLSSKLKGRMDVVNSKIGENLKEYGKDRSDAHLDQCYVLIMQSRTEIDNPEAARVSARRFPIRAAWLITSSRASPASPSRPAAPLIPAPRPQASARPGSSPSCSQSGIARV